MDIHWFGMYMYNILIRFSGFSSLVGIIIKSHPEKEEPLGGNM